MSIKCLVSSLSFASDKKHLIKNPNHSQISPTSFPLSFSWRSFHLLQMYSRALFSGDQGYYSCSSEACQNNQKLNAFTDLPSLLPNPRTLSHKSSFIPRTCNLWNVLPSSCFPESYISPSFKSKINKLDLTSLPPSLSLSSFVGASFRTPWPFPNTKCMNRYHWPYGWCQDSSMVRFWRVDPMASGSSPTSAKLSLRVRRVASSL